MLLACRTGFAAEVELTLRDAVTGAPLEAVVELYGIEHARGVTREWIESVTARSPDAQVHVDGGRVRFRVEVPMLARVHASRHASMVTVLEPGARGFTLWMRPLDQNGLQRAAPALGTLRLHGVVRDADSLRTLADVELRLQPLGWATRSDGDGGYLFEFDVPPLVDDTPVFLTLETGPRDQPTIVDRAVPLLAGEIWRMVDLGGGESALHRQQHPLHTGIQVDDRVPRTVAAGDDPDQPPLSIRVGFADASCTQTCCTGSCTHVCVFDLETYVRRGITYEWFGSWTQHSLRAGTVAYRSYGAWHALNPVAGRPFDLCSSACCQVNGPNVIVAGTLAARATAGLMLKRNDAVFRSEYSAENNCLQGTLSCSNNDLSCGNGFNGSPQNNWPCLADEVGLNRDCFGHGRGMSQWGTQRWSITPHFRRWPWIVNQYYNAHGAGTGLRTSVMTRVLDILDAAPSAAAVLPGQTFEIVVEALNRAAESHQAVLIGASIRRGSDPFLSDPANDRLLELDPGITLATRSFVVPPGAPPGSYALWVSLFLDVDADGAVGGSDLVQALVQFPAALQVLSVDDPIFADGFE